MGNAAIAQKAISRDWSSFVQTIDISTDKEIKFKVVASAKTEMGDESSRSGIWVRTDNKNGEPGFFDNMADRPIVSDEWSSSKNSNLAQQRTK